MNLIEKQMYYFSDPIGRIFFSYFKFKFALILLFFVVIIFHYFASQVNASRCKNV